VSDAKKNYGPLIGEVNVLEATIGQRGMGKSTYQCHRVFELVTQYQGHVYVIGHSLGARLPKKLPAELGGHDLPVTYHSSIESVARGVSEQPKRWHILAPPIDLSGRNGPQDSVDDLIAWSIKFSDALRERAYAREHPIRGALRAGVARDYNGIQCPCIAIIVDEGIAMESAGVKGSGIKSQIKKDWFLRWIYSLRHYHTALFYAIQNATARNWQLLSEATRVVVFRVKHQWAINAVQAAGGTHAEMREVRKLEPHEYIALGEDPTLADDYEDEQEAERERVAELERIEREERDEVEDEPPPVESTE
jgi:hypothetical protein